MNYGLYELLIFNLNIDVALIEYVLVDCRKEWLATTVINDNNDRASY